MIDRACKHGYHECVKCQVDVLRTAQPRTVRLPMRECVEHRARWWSVLGSGCPLCSIDGSRHEWRPCDELEVRALDETKCVAMFDVRPTQEQVDQIIDRWR